jgi:hypothetical protein
MPYRSRPYGRSLRGRRPSLVRAPGRLLRRLAAGERVSDQVDWENVAEEIKDVGRSSRRTCRSQLLQALLHGLEAKAWPMSRDAPHWRSEARVARIDSADPYASSMRQFVDVADPCAKALRAPPETVDNQPPLPVPQTCLVTLDDLPRDPPGAV